MPQLPTLRLPDLRPHLRAIPALRPVPVLGVIGSHAFRVGRRLPDSRLLDRLLRGRIWIGLLAVLLLGLVAINVSLLKLNAQAGHNAEKVKTLRIQNDRLGAKVSRLRSGDRVERAASRLGLVMPEAGSVRYLSVGSKDGLRAARALRAGNRIPGTGPLAGAVTNPINRAPVAVTPATGPSVTATPPATTTTTAPTSASGTTTGAAAGGTPAVTPTTQQTGAPVAGGAQPTAPTTPTG